MKGIGCRRHLFFYFCVGGRFMAVKRENTFQANLIKELKGLFPGCVIIKNDANQLQGISDLLILYEDKWAMLECKRAHNASHQPNQDYYIDKFNAMSFAAFIYPENREEVLNDLESTFRARRKPRVSKR